MQLQDFPGVWCVVSDRPYSLAPGTTEESHSVALDAVVLDQGYVLARLAAACAAAALPACAESLVAACAGAHAGAASALVAASC